MAKQRATVYTATKSASVWNVDDPTGWNILGQATKASELELVPILAFCVDDVSQTLSTVPFSLYDGEREIDNSETWDNVIGFMPNPQDFIRTCAASLLLSGAAYYGRQNNAAGFTKGTKYYAIGSTTPQIKPDTTPENLTFVRDGKTLPAKEVFYAWLPDAHVEFGPATNYPLLRALKAAGALSSISAFIDNYMSSGMVKAFIAQSETPPRDDGERDQIEDYLTRMLTGVRRAMARIRVLRKGITIQSIGGGLDELRGFEISTKIKLDVLQAFGVPESRANSSAANYATAQMDTFNYVTSRVLPMGLVIQQAVNEQLLTPWGYTMRFEPTRMDAYRAVLAEKIKPVADVAKVFALALSPANALKASLDLLGVSIPEDVQELIMAAIAEEAKKPEPPPTPPAAPIPAAPVEVETIDPEAEEPDDEEEMPTKALVELDKWQLKSEKAGKLVTWHPVDLPVGIVNSIKGGMPWEAAREMLKPKHEAEQPGADILALAHAIDRATDAATKALPIPQAIQPMTINLTAQMPAPGQPDIVVNVPQQPPAAVTNNITVQPADNVNQVTLPPMSVENNITAIPGKVEMIMPPMRAAEIILDSNGKPKEIRPK